MEKFIKKFIGFIEYFGYMTIMLFVNVLVMLVASIFGVVNGYYLPFFAIVILVGAYIYFFYEYYFKKK